MHICFLCNEYPPAGGGGIGSFVCNLSRAAVAKGHNAHVVGVYRNRAGEFEDDMGVAVRRLAAARLPGSRFLLNGFTIKRALRDIYASSPIDIIEGQEIAFGSDQWSGPARKVIRMHGGHHFFAAARGDRPAAWRGWQERRSFERANVLCAVSQYVAETTRDLLRLGNRQITVLPNFVDTDRFCPQPEAVIEQGRIVFVGALCEKKGIRQLVQAMPEIVSAVPTASLLVFGRDRNEKSVGGSFLAHLRTLIPEDLRQRIAFEGAVGHERLIHELARAAVCVFPSHMEAMPMTWLEAMSMGKAVVGSNTGPGPEVIEDQVSGLLCNPHEPDSIAKQVARCLNDAALCKRLGEAARRRVLDNFSVERMVDRNLEFYEQVLAGKAS
ncbi:MAG: glycosyltransferase family 4 protein [Bryobacteraceae bacterium]|nr:glycosyltransferase family 4 protein [Bryobacteraceae bacterium]